MKRMVLGTLAAWIAVFIVGPLFFVAQTQAPTLPAPTVNRVAFPFGYRDTFKLFYVFDNYQNRQIRAVYANGIAASVGPGAVSNYPYGSVFLFESYSVRQDASGEPLLDDNGRFIPNTLTTIFVMEKQRGFGVDYKEIRNGEWEYAQYNPNGSLGTPASNTGSCALCHLTGANLGSLRPDSQAIGAQWDYVFRPDLFFGGGTGAVPKGVLQHYVFVPSTIYAQPGETVTVYNSDQLVHRIVADDGSFDTGNMNPGASFTLKAGERGSVVSYHCAIHTRVKGMMVVRTLDIDRERTRPTQ
ncbi:MAG: cytochrome P460 family protein [Acidobacteria bacterium]|nr:cytochrome P460 family protein [Acidobacteriota bacterium]